jgi:thiaminase (transcriptional activator TenA)
MIPCPWTYLEIAQKLSKSHQIQNDDKIYKKWMQFYSSDESCRQINELKKILCVLADEDANDKGRLAMKKHFANACK